MKKLMRLSIIWFGIIFLLCLLVVVAILIAKWGREPAFMETKWGMTRSEVESALGLPLSAPKFDPDKYLGYPIANHSKFNKYVLCTPDFKLFKERTEVEFDFFDEKLFRYRLSIFFPTMKEAENQLVPMIEEQFSNAASEFEEVDQLDFPVQKQWVCETSTAKLFVHKDGRASVKITHRSTWQEIEKLGKEEKKTLF